MKIQIFQIKVNDGRRKISPEAVHELADSISKVGLLNPITVDQDYTLIAGLHRLEAAKLLGWTEIECNVSSLEGLMAELAEIDENLVRRGLDYIDEGKQLARRKEIYEALHPETKQGGDRKSEEIKTKPFRFDSAKPFSVDASEKLGVSRRSVEQKIQVATGLTPEATDIVRESGIGFKKALKLSRLPPEQQADAARQLAEEKSHQANEYHPASAEAEPAEAEEQAPKPPALPPKNHAPPAEEAGYYPTIRDSVADLKNPDKDRRPTPSTFLLSFTLFLQRFCQSVKSYAVNEYAPVFPALTQEHLDQLQQEICSVHTTLDDLFNTIERKSKK